VLQYHVNVSLFIFVLDIVLSAVRCVHSSSIFAMHGWTRFWTGSGLPESTPAGFYIFCSDPDPESKICEKPDPNRSHFSILALAGVGVVISQVSRWVNYGWNDDCSRSLNWSRILKFEE